MNQNIISFYKEGLRKSFSIVLPLFLIWMVSCDDMNSIHEKYYEWGEDIYTGIVDSLKVYGGDKRAKLEWELNADPRITKVAIFWNMRADSIVLDVNRTVSGRLAMSYLVENLSEGDYVFELITRDNEGHFSMSTEAVTYVYGNFYQQSLKNRKVSTISKQEDGTILIQWEPIASKDIQYVNVLFEVNSTEQTVRVENTESKTILTGLKSGDIINVQTVYKPENGLDEFLSPYSKYTTPKFERQIDKNKFSAVVLAGDNTSENNGRGLSKIWDGAVSNPGILHTIENAADFNFPHHFTFDLGVMADISRFRIWPRTDAGAFSGHSPRYFEIWGTNELKKPAADEGYWKTEAWKSDWKLMGDHEIIKPGSDQGTVWAVGWEYGVNETIGKVRYIRLVIKTQNWQGSNCVNIGEITLWGDDL